MKSTIRTNNVVAALLRSYKAFTGGGKATCPGDPSSLPYCVALGLMTEIPSQLRRRRRRRGRRRKRRNHGPGSPHYQGFTVTHTQTITTLGTTCLDE